MRSDAASAAGREYCKQELTQQRAGYGSQKKHSIEGEYLTLSSDSLPVNSIAPQTKVNTAC